MLLLALVGTATAGFGTALRADTGAPVAGTYHGDTGLLTVTGNLEKNNFSLAGCHFPIYNLPAYYICIMFCRIGGGGDACAPSCEAQLTVCS
jgi:hypothetical protein